MKCSDCGEELGTGDPYDLMRSHLFHCSGPQAKKVREAMDEEGIGPRYGGDC